MEILHLRSPVVLRRNNPVYECKSTDTLNVGAKAILDSKEESISSLMFRPEQYPLTSDHGVHLASVH